MTIEQAGRYGLRTGSSPAGSGLGLVRVWVLIVTISAISAPLIGGIGTPIGADQRRRRGARA